MRNVYTGRAVAKMEGVLENVAETVGDRKFAIDVKKFSAEEFECLDDPSPVPGGEGTTKRLTEHFGGERLERFWIQKYDIGNTF